jgi:hypothetical protein
MGIMALAAVQLVIGGNEVAMMPCAVMLVHRVQTDTIIGGGSEVGDAKVKGYVRLTVALVAFTGGIRINGDICTCIQRRAARCAAMTEIATVWVSRRGVVAVGAACGIGGVVNREHPLLGDIIAGAGADGVLMAVVAETGLRLDQFRYAGAGKVILATPDQGT